MTSMRRVVATPDGVQVQQAEAPEPAPGEVRIRSVAVGVCGTDVHAVVAAHPFVPLPYAPGHEVVGIVESAGEGVDPSWVGKRVTVEPDLPCGECATCRRGDINLCERLQFLGCGYEQGAMADLFTIPEGRLHEVPGTLDDLAATLIEPLSTPVHAVRLVGPLERRRIVIIGAGSIGLLALAAVRASGGENVVVTDVRADKRERAVRLGASAAVDATAVDAVQQAREAIGGSADVVFDCVGGEATMRQAIAMADRGGTVALVGVPAGDLTLPMALVQDRRIRIQGVATYLPRDVARAIELLEQGAVDTAEMVTAVRGMEEAAEAFRLASSGDQVKVLVSDDPTITAAVGAAPS
jgi:2-desacetyl-2-hydroxyethyl bacteriochlorophyllide A dehydrogenase